MRKINWGIIAPGRIASAFVRALSACEEATCKAVASRSAARAKTFAQQWGFEEFYGGSNAYERLFANPDIQAVYIASPHSNHADLSLQALRAGKAVLCEKPAAVNAAQLKNVLDYARSQKLFYMEAMWMKFNPAYRSALDWVRAGKIGELTCIQADFCINKPYKPKDRLYDPNLAGGALLDVGIYPITFAMTFAGLALQDIAAKKSPANQKTGFAPAPDKTQSAALIGKGGVDYWNSINMEWNRPNQPQLFARLSSAISIEGRSFLQTALLIGKKGKILLPHFWAAEELAIYDADDMLIKKEQFPFKVNGYEYEIDEVNRCINAGLIESPLHSQADTLSVIKTLDNIRTQWGLYYHFEKTDTRDEKVQTSKNSLAGGTIVVYTDGSCSGNPGNGGWAAIILADDKEISLSGGEKLTTNNRMELKAAIAALSRLYENTAWKTRPIAVYSDSQYVKNGITGWIKNWKQNGWKTAAKEPVKNQDLWTELDKLICLLTVNWHWVRGHAGNKYNELCDRLAVEAGQNASSL